jgi:solute carrier family 25 folate transporter 32
MQVMGDLNKNKAAVATSVTGEKIQTKPAIGLMQSLRDIVKADGVRGAFRGLSPTLITVPSFWGLYFPLYEYVKKDLHNKIQDSQLSGDQNGDLIKHMIHMGSAIGSGAIADFFCNPMFVVRTRMQTEVLHYMEVPRSERKPHGIIRTVKGLYNEGGIRIFWRGFTASLLGLSHVGIQFPVYEYLKAKARERAPEGEESVLDLLLASGASKMVATSTTYPHEVIRSRVMDYRGSDRNNTGLIRTFHRIVKEEGYSALYTGLHVSLIRVIPNCCITFMTYEMILRWSKQFIKNNDTI